MLVSVASVVVCNVTAVSAVVGPQLQMDIHFVVFKCSFFYKAFPTILTLKWFLIIRSVSLHHVKFKASYFYSAFWTRSFVFMGHLMSLKIMNKYECFATLVALVFRFMNFMPFLTMILKLRRVLEGFATNIAYRQSCH